MTTKVIVIVAIAVLTTVGMFVFGKIVENNDTDESSQKKK